jgi:hypothetical protein
MTPIPEAFHFRGPLVVRQDIVHVHDHSANLFAEVTDRLAQYDFANHATAVTAFPPSFMRVLSFEAPLPVYAFQALCDVDTNNNQKGNFLSATNDKIIEGTCNRERINGRRRGLSRNCG